MAEISLAQRVGGLLKRGDRLRAEIHALPHQKPPVEVVWASG